VPASLFQVSTRTLSFVWASSAAQALAFRKLGRRHSRTPEHRGLGALQTPPGAVFNALQRPRAGQALRAGRWPGPVH